MIRSIGESIEEMREKMDKKTIGGVNSERSNAVERLMLEVMKEKPTQTRRFQYWLGRTKKMNAQRIHELIGSAKEGRNPGALFNHLLKKENGRK